MFLIPFVSLIICYPLRQPTILQSSAIAIILLVTLIVATLKKHLNPDLSIENLPYLAMPVILFASINRHLEHSTNNAIMCFSMFVATLIIFSQKESHGKWLPRSMVICANIHFVLQIFGMITHDEKMAVSTIFPLANEMTFFYMVTMFSSIFIYFKDPNTFWKKYSAVIGLQAFILIIVGPSIHTKKLEIGGEHALGVWLGLVCGILFTITLFLWKKINLPKKPFLSFSALIFLIIISVPIIVVNSNIFNSTSRGYEASTRIDNWRAGWKIVQDKPFGVGFGSYGANVMQRWPALKESKINGYGAVMFSDAHSQYLQILTEIGWLGWLYYCALFAIPWFVSIFRYLKTGELRFICIAGTLAAMLSTMAVAEAISMFAFIQIIHWMFLIYCVKILIPLRAKDVRVKIFEIRNMFLIISIPLMAFLIYDRGKQIYSKYLFLEYPLTRAIETYPKNSEALGFVWSYYVGQGNFQEALKTLDKIEEMAGYSWPVSQARAETYYTMGEFEKACEVAKFPLSHYTDPWTLNLKEMLKCEYR